MSIQEFLLIYFITGTIIISIALGIASASEETRNPPPIAIERVLMMIVFWPVLVISILALGVTLFFKRR